MITASDGPGPDCCSWWAGGMLAPHCELEAAEPLIGRLGLEGLAFWKAQDPAPRLCGSLVLAPRRDAGELDRFARLTEGWRWLDGAGVHDLEPDLGERFGRGLFYADEGHLDPRASLAALYSRLSDLGVAVESGRTLCAEALAAKPEADWRLDCRGLAARDSLDDLRGVKGEMVILHSQEVSLSRPVRLLHPRFPLYIVPRAEGQFMVGATMIETQGRRRVSARSLIELLSSAYALHPAFGEAEVVEIGVDARPAFPDNLPRLIRRGRTLFINGCYRHGFLVAPALASRAAALLLDGDSDPELVHD